MLDVELVPMLDVAHVSGCQLTPILVHVVTSAVYYVLTVHLAIPAAFFSMEGMLAQMGGEYIKVSG